MAAREIVLEWSVDPRDLEWPGRFLARLPLALDATAATLGKRAIEIARARMAELFRYEYTSPTGRLAESVHSTPVPDLHAVDVTVNADGTVPYALQREFGGWIVPRAANYLHFLGIEGEPVYPVVVHQFPEPYWDKTLDMLEEEVPVAFEGALYETLAAALRVSAVEKI